MVLELLLLLRLLCRSEGSGGAAALGGAIVLCVVAVVIQCYAVVGCACCIDGVVHDASCRCAVVVSCTLLE